MTDARRTAVLNSIEAMVRAVPRSAVEGQRCPACNRKGLHVPLHPHATGHKDVGRLRCRFCHAEFARVWG